MNSIFLLRAGWHYDGAIEIRAFADKDDAEAQAALCREYHQTMPKTPSIEQYDENEWAAYVVANDAWRAGHPGGESAQSADFFDVIEVEFVDNAAKAASQDTQGEKNA